MSYRLPAKTSSGRELKPSRKLRERLRDQIGIEYEDLLDGVIRLAEELEANVLDKKGEEIISEGYEEWVALYEELRMAEGELRRYLESDEVRKHDEDFVRNVHYLEHVKAYAERYLHDFKDEKRKARSSPVSQIESDATETEDLKTQIRRMEADISRTAELLSKTRIQERKARGRIDQPGSGYPLSSTPNDPRVNQTKQRVPLDYEAGFVPAMGTRDDLFSYRRQFHPHIDGPESGYVPPKREEGYVLPGRIDQLPTIVQAPLYDDYQPRMKPRRREDEDWLYMQGGEPRADRGHQDSQRPPVSRYDPRYDQPPLLDRMPRYPPGDRVPGYGPSPPLDPTVAVLQQLAGILQEKKESRLPSIEPEKFSGDIMKFPSWIASYETLIEKRFRTAGERMFYLQKYTTGDAKDLISGFEDFDTEDAYSHAKMMLMTRYGDKMKIAESYRSKLEKWPAIKSGDRVALQKFSDFLWKCHKAMGTIGYLSSLDAPEENRKLVAKLPFYIADRWNRIIDVWVYDQSPDYSQMYLTQTRPYPPFMEFCKFLSSESRVANGPCSAMEMKSSASGDAQKDSHKKPARKATNLAVTTEPVKKPPEKNKSNEGYRQKRDPSEASAVKRLPDGTPVPWCVFCKDEHWLSECAKFIGGEFEEKKKFLLEKGICFGCFRRGHTFKDCRIRRPELMKSSEVIQDKAREKKSNEVVNMTTRAGLSRSVSSTIVPVWVSQKNSPDREVLVYAAVDSQSNSCFITPDLTERLALSSSDVSIKLVTMGTVSYVNTKRVSSLRIRGYKESKRVKIPRCYQQELIPADRETIPDPDLVAEWPHLERVAKELMKPDEDVEIGLLLGYNCSAVFRQEERVFGDIYEPFAMRTPIGWSVMGKLSESEEDDDEDRLCFTTSTREINSAEIKKVFDMGFEPEIDDEKASQDDKRFLEIMEKSIIQRDDMHLQMDLPMKADDMKLPDNRKVAEKRFTSLKKKLKADEVYSKRYRDFVNNMIEAGQAEIVDEDAEDTEDGMVWYIPHLGVYHPRKPTKLRVVFDASARYLSMSLNECLLSGPDMTNNLVGVLLRFRSERIALTCDVEGMFHQVFVTPRFRNLLRFLWVEDGNPDGKMVVCRVLVHLFGATSSPGCANYALKEIARRFGEEYGEITAEFLKRFFYVDDGIISLRTEDEVVDLVYSSHCLCRRGGMWLHKYSSNSKAVLARIPEFLKAQDLKQWRPKIDNLPVETTLGVKWCQETDCFIFMVQLLEKPATRRGMLSSLSSVYDPLGLIAPVLLKGRMMLQKLCSMKFDWDDDIPALEKTMWKEWYSQLRNLEELRIRRCVKNEVSAEESVQLHLFSDASVSGYGVCAYLRLQDREGNVDTSLVFAKARVAPSKYVTIPRLELQAALLSVKVGRFLEKELQYNELELFYWSDSKVALGYIYNSSKRFHIYVCNRVTTIREASDVSQWRYVSTKNNPADTASRGLMAEELVNDDRWWHGPEFVKQGDYDQNEECFEVDEDDPEVRKEKIMLGTKLEENHMLTSLTKVSSWKKILRVVSTCRRYIEMLRMNRKDRSQISLCKKPLTATEIRNAEKILIRQIQITGFGEVYEALLSHKKYPESREEAKKRNVALKRETNLYRLDVYMSDDEMMKVGGRVRRAGIAEELKHPTLLPKKHPMIEKIVRYHHDRNAHVGRGGTVMALRTAGLWIVQGRAAVERAIRCCVICKRLRGALMGQRMSDLPSFRLEAVPPFTRTGVDVFGPFEIKQARSVRKRWICIFVDMVMRAVHVEVLFLMDISSFVNAFRRMVARRGPVQELYCDRGSNFIGTRNEFENARRELNVEEMQENLAEEGCDVVRFNFNFPKSSHMGGSWERMIRSFRGIFTRLLTTHSHLLDDELLSTLAVEAEAILNCRPLTYAGMTDPEDFPPLTPMQLLTMKSQVVLPPPGKFIKEDMYCPKRWRRVQYLSNQFWSQWLKEYVPSLQERKKWNEKKENLQKGDVVLLFEDGLKRNAWPMARIEEVVPGEDGLIRKVKIKTATASYDRPIHKLVFLFRPDVNEAAD